MRDYTPAELGDSVAGLDIANITRDEEMVEALGLGLPVMGYGIIFERLLIAVGALMVLLSITLPARVNRVTNLVVPALYIPVSVYNASGESAWLPFYALTICVEVLILAFIMRTAWTWPRSGSHARSRTM